MNNIKRNIGKILAPTFPDIFSAGSNVCLEQKNKTLLEKFIGPGSFTNQGCLCGNDTACEGALEYIEQAARKPMRQDWLARRVNLAEFFRRSRDIKGKREERRNPVGLDDH